MTTTPVQTTDLIAVAELPIAPSEVVELLTTPAGVSQWWGPTEGDATTMTTSFGEHGVNAVRVVEAGPTRVVWESVRPLTGTPTAHVEEWLGTTMEFDLIPTGAGTRVQFRHLGLTPQLVCWDDCLAGLNHFMASLEALGRTGTGMPFGA
jgi:uncharacterized protein YndB with AHSA1/START domain